MPGIKWGETLVFAQGRVPAPAPPTRVCNCTRRERLGSPWPSRPGTSVHAWVAGSSQDLIKVHHSFLRAIDVSMMAGGSTLAKVFLDFKER